MAFKAFIKIASYTLEKTIQILKLCGENRFAIQNVEMFTVNISIHLKVALNELL